MLTVIIPAHNEEGYIGRCLTSVLTQTVTPDLTGGLQVIVAVNGTTDGTVSEAEKFEVQAKAAGWELRVLNIAEGGKPIALNEGDRVAGPMMDGDSRIYLDADIVMEAEIFAQIHAALAKPMPAYASGQMIVTDADSWVTRKFIHLWRRVPFMASSGATGAGLFAVNAAGRARWGAFPSIIADDSFVRLQFTPEERTAVAASFYWPPVEGFSALVKVRRRQDAGDAQIAELFPELVANEGKASVTPKDHLKLFLGSPLSYVVYVTVKLAVKFGGKSGPSEWTRGR